MLNVFKFQVSLQRVSDTSFGDDSVEHLVRGPQVHVPGVGQKGGGVPPGQLNRGQRPPGPPAHLPLLLLLQPPAYCQTYSTAAASHW